MLFFKKITKKRLLYLIIFLKKNKNEEEFFSKINESLEAKEEKKNIKIYDELSKFEALYLTTNADDLFEYKFEDENILHKIEDIINSRIDRRKLYHLHGSRKEPENMIFTTNKYLERYINNDFVNKINEIFSNYNILFVGYGLEEFEIMEHLLTKIDPDTSKIFKNYALMPYKEKEELLIKHDIDYFKELGIDLIPYNIREKDYEFLYKILKNWTSNLLKEEKILFNSYEDLEKYTGKFSEGNYANIKQIIKNDKNKEDTFFNLISKYTNNPQWLIKLNEDGYLDYNKNPSIIHLDNGYRFPKWNILEYLLKISSDNKQKNNKNMKIIFSFVNSLVDEELYGKKKDNYHTNYMIIKIIMNFPKEKIKDKYTDFMINSIKSKYNQGIVESVISEYNLVDIIYKDNLIKIFNYLFENKAEVRTYWINEIILKNIDSISKKYPNDFSHLVLSKIKKENSFFYYSNIFDLDDLKAKEYDIHHLIIFFIREIIKKSDPSNIKDTLKSMISSKIIIEKRLAIYGINFHYEELNKIFWSSKFNPLNIVDLRKEILNLFKCHKNDLDHNNINKIIEWLDNIEFDFSYMLEKEKSDYIVMHKKCLLKPLTNCGFQEIEDYYNNLDRINPYEPENINFNNGLQEMKIRKIDLEDKSIDEIIRFYNNIKENEIKDFNGYNYKKNLSDYIKVNFYNLYDKLVKFIDMKDKFQIEIIDALRTIEISSNKSYINSIFEYIKTYLKNKKVNLREYIMYTNNNLIELIDENQADELEKIIIKIIDENESLTNKEDKKIDNIARTINSLLGISFKVLLKITLRRNELNEQKEEIKWSSQVKEIFNDFLKRKNSLNYFTILGMYLYILYYIDKQWVIKNIGEIFNQQKYDLRKASMEGFLGNSKFTKNLYLLVKDGDNYSYAINNFEENEYRKIAIQHIIIAFLNDDETINGPDSLLKKILEDKKYFDINHVIWYLSIQKNIKDDKLSALWKNIKKILDNSVEKNKFLLYKLCLFIKNFDYLDTDFIKFFKDNIKYSNKDYSLYKVIKGFKKHIDTQPEKVADMFKSMVEDGMFIGFEKKEIIEVIEELYNKEYRAEANTICNKYLENGFDFLKDIFEKHNP
jgi:hypothetical protein